MKNQFENDPVLGQLSKAARKPKAPKLSEDLLVAASSKDSSVKARKFKLPALFLSLASATAAVALVAVVANPAITNTESYSLTEFDENLLVTNFSLYCETKEIGFLEIIESWEAWMEEVA